MSGPNRWVYQDKRWKDLRKRAFARDRHICQICGQRVRYDVPFNHPRSAICDHIIPLSVDIRQAFNINNLQTLHKECHDRAKQQTDKRGHAAGCDVNGFPLDPNHPFNRGRQ